MNDDNFLSIDRLVEFGMGMAVARQMMDSMNHALNSTQMPGLQTPQLPVPTQHYFAVQDGKAAGPFAAQELSRLINEGKVNKDTYIWRPGMAKWQAAQELPDVLRLVALAPPPFTPGEQV